MMTKMNFPPSITDLVMKCVETVSFKVLLNGTPTKSFSPHRGIRQGDPLSPFLFVMCTKGLLAMLRQAKVVGDIYGLAMGRGAPKISHFVCG